MLVFVATFLFFGLCNGITLECEYKTAGYEYFGSVYYCEAKVVQLNAGHAVTGVSGIHANGKTNDDVKGIRIDNQALDFIPRDVNKYFKNIRGLHMDNTKLNFISKFDLRQFPELIYLTVTNNLIEFLEGDLFSYTTKIDFVVLDYNKITSVGANLFSGLKDLRTLRFHRNTCTSVATYNNPTEVLIVSEIIVKACPLTAEMVARTVNNLQSIIEPAIAETNVNVGDLQTKLRRQEVRLAELETIISEMDARK
jgi:hypothetical protein